MIDSIVGKPRALLSLRLWFGVIVLVVWNVGFLYARRLGAPFTRPGLVVGGVFALATGLLALGIVTMLPIRKLALHPGRTGYYEPQIFRFIAFVCLFIGLGWLTAGIFFHHAG